MGGLCHLQGSYIFNPNGVFLNFLPFINNLRDIILKIFKGGMGNM